MLCCFVLLPPLPEKVVEGIPNVQFPSLAKRKRTITATGVRDPAAARMRSRTGWYVMILCLADALVVTTVVRHLADLS
jgi:hypothetical protein